ncbi:unnamed protein product [Lampetra planeri]
MRTLWSVYVCEKTVGVVLGVCEQLQLRRVTHLRVTGRNIVRRPWPSGDRGVRRRQWRRSEHGVAGPDRFGTACRQKKSS